MSGAGVWEWDSEAGDAGVFIRTDGVETSIAPAAQSERLLVADSWLVTDGCVRALEAHRRRFARSCRVRAGEIEAGGAEAEVFPTGAESAEAAVTAAPTVADHAASDHFWDALVALLPRTGDWFPRVELVDGGPSQTEDALQLRLRVRPAPARGTTVVVWDPQVPDSRVHPQIKGPDLDQLGELRTEALARGAREVLLTDASGHVVEAANSSVFWWEEDALWTPASAVVPLDGVTASLVAEAAQRRGITVRSRPVTRAELEEHEVWLTNALHGIRAVSQWRTAEGGSADDALAGSAPPDSSATQAPIDRTRLQGWRDEWDAHARPLPDASARD